MTDILSDEHPAAWADDVTMPALLRFAWRTYGGNVRTELADGGFDDLPRNGAYVIGAMANDSLTLGGDGQDASSAANGLARQLGVSKQAVSQLLDALVSRGYLAREADPDDRRRTRLSLTERGTAAAGVTAKANADMDALVREMLTAEGLTVLRRSLAAVIHAGHQLREQSGEHSH